MAARDPIRLIVPYVQGGVFVKTVKRADNTETAQITVNFAFVPPLAAEKTDPADPRLLVTVHGTGYLFAGDVTQDG